ncbi:MAG: hypothetical protein ACRDHL_01390 [Candidatus Promineifilaceae bacterium]
MKSFVRLLALLALSLALGASVASASNARKPAIDSAAARVVELQRTDAGWEGTWFWYVGNTFNATNLTGVTALGLLEAYQDTNDTAYLDAAVDAAGFIMTHLGAGATGAQYHTRTTAPDIVFLHRLSQVTGDSSYATRANAEWANIKTFWPTAGDLDALFRVLNRPSIWDIVFFMEAAHLSGDSAWADGAAAIVANISDPFYYDPAEDFWYALNVAHAVYGLVSMGYSGAYNAEVVALLDTLVSLISDSSVGSSAQMTAYAVLALASVGGSANGHANDLARWLADNRAANGGYLEPDAIEYAESNGEALRALATTIGTNVTVDGFQPGSGQNLNSAWQAAADSQAVPYSGD